jgi:hypothetical protein
MPGTKLVMQGSGEHVLCERPQWGWLRGQHVLQQPASRSRTAGKEPARAVGDQS